eukprot:242145_1
MVMETPSNDEESSTVCLNDLNRSVESFIGLRGSKGCSLASLWAGVFDFKAPDTCLDRFVWQSCLKLHGRLLSVVDLKESQSKRMKTVQHDICYDVWKKEKVWAALNALEVNLPNIEQAKLIGLVPFKALCHRELGLYPEVNLKILDFQALEVIAIASKAGATVADVAEGLKGYANIASPEGGKDYKRLDDVKNIHFIISKLLARKLITRIHGEKSNMNHYCLTRFVSVFMREDVKINKQFWRDEVMPLFGSSSNLSISLEELRSRLKLSSSLMPAIKDALVNKETGQPIVLKLFRQPNGARYHFVQWLPGEKAVLPADDHYEVLNHAKTTVEEEETMVEYSLARQFLAVVSSKGAVGCPVSELAYSVSAEHKQVQNRIKRLVNSGQIGTIYRQQGRQRTSYLVAAEFLNTSPPPPEFPHPTHMLTRLTSPWKSDEEEEALSTIEDKQKKTLKSLTKVINLAPSEMVSHRATASAAAEPPIVLVEEKTTVKQHQQPLPITQERQNRHIHLLEIVQREKIVTVCEAAQEIRLKEKNSGVMSSAGYMDKRSLKRILNSVLSEPTVGVEIITLDVPKMNKTGKGQDSKKESVLKLASVSSDEVQLWIAKMELANEEKRNELGLKSKEAKTSKEKLKKDRGSLVLRRTTNHRDSGSHKSFKTAHMLRTKILHKYIWNSVMSLEQNRERHNDDLAAVNLGEVLSLLPLRVFFQAFGVPPKQLFPQYDIRRLMRTAWEHAMVPILNLPKELKSFVQLQWYKNLLLESVNILESLNILLKIVDIEEKKNIASTSSSSSSTVSVLPKLELGYYNLKNDIEIPLEVEASSPISELRFSIKRWKDAETFYDLLHTCAVNTNKEGYSGIRLSADLMALNPDMSQETFWENITSPRRDEPEPAVDFFPLCSAQGLQEESFDKQGFPNQEQDVTQSFEIERFMTKEPVVVEIEDQSGEEDGNSDFMRPKVEMSENLPMSSLQHPAGRTKRSKGHGGRKKKMKHSTYVELPSFDLAFRAKEKPPIIPIEDQSRNHRPFVDDSRSKPLDRGCSNIIFLNESYQSEWNNKPLHVAALLHVRQAIIALYLSLPNAAHLVQLSLYRFSSENIQRALWYMRCMNELDTVEDDACAPTMVEKESEWLTMGITGPSPFLKLSDVVLDLVALPPQKCEDSTPGFPYPTSLLSGINDASETFIRSAAKCDSMLFERKEHAIKPEVATAALSLGTTSYGTPSNLAVSLGMQATRHLATQINVSPHPDHDITLERGKTPVLQLLNFEARAYTMEPNTSEETALATTSVLAMEESYNNNPSSYDETFDLVLNRVNEKKEKGISLKEAGGVAVLLTLYNLCNMKKVISVPCPNGLRWVSKQYWGIWTVQKCYIKKQKVKPQLDNKKRKANEEEDNIINTADDLEYTNDLVPTRIWIGIDGSRLEHLLSKLNCWVVGKLLQCPGCNVENLAMSIPIVTATEVAELMRDMELAGVVRRCGYGPLTGLGSPIWENTCFSLAPRGLEYFQRGVIPPS